MALDATVEVVAGQWTLLTPDDCTKFSLKLVKGSGLLIKATVGANPPAATYRDGAPLEQGEAMTNTMADMFSGVTGANRLYGWSKYPAKVFISHD